MKKSLVALLIAALLVTICCLALADDLQLDKSVTSGSTTVSLTVDSTADNYVFTIPAAVVIDPVTQYGYGTLSLKAGWELVSVNGIKLAISNVANGVKNGVATSSDSAKIITNTYLQNFTLKDASRELSTTYAVKASTLSYCLGGSSGSSGGTGTYASLYTDTLLSANKGGDNTADKTCELTFYVRTMPDAGVYTDTITFAITTK